MTPFEVLIFIWSSNFSSENPFFTPFYNVIEKKENIFVSFFLRKEHNLCVYNVQKYRFLYFHVVLVCVCNTFFKMKWRRKICIGNIFRWFLWRTDRSETRAVVYHYERIIESNNKISFFTKFYIFLYKVFIFH